MAAARFVGAAPKDFVFLTNATVGVNSIVRSLDCPVVMGNHDEYCAGDMDLTGFNPMAADAIKWTRQQLTDEERSWLRNLKYVRNVESFTIVHATLDLPEKWAYVFDRLAAQSSFNYQHTPVCFNGHTHVPIAFVRGSAGIQGGLYTKIKIEVAVASGAKYQPPRTMSSSARSTPPMTTPTGR